VVKLIRNKDNMNSDMTGSINATVSYCLDSKVEYVFFVDNYSKDDKMKSKVIRYSISVCRM